MYGLLFSATPLPWDQPLDAGPVTFQVSSSDVTLLLGGRPVLNMGESYAKKLGLPRSMAGLLGLGASLSEGHHLEDEIRVPGGRLLRLFADIAVAEEWQQEGREAEYLWQRELQSLLQ